MQGKWQSKGKGKGQGIKHEGYAAPPDVVDPLEKIDSPSLADHHTR